MVNITRLYCGAETASDPLRYGATLHAPTLHAGETAHRTEATAAARRPVVVWTSSRRCNLSCAHCYTDSHNVKYEGELSTDEAKTMIEDLSVFGVPSLLISGGEPLMRPDFFELAGYARSLGLRLTLSTNGTLITPEVARRIRDLGFSYVGISLDGIGEIHDQFRGRRGAYEQALSAFRNCSAVEQKVGLRLTLTRHNVENLDAIFDLIEREGIQRACFYHLVPSGRGADVTGLTPDETRVAIERIMDRARDLHASGVPKEILTVGNAADGVLVYQRVLREDPNRAAEVKRLIEWNGGGAHGSGVGLANIDATGAVHPDQFWQTHTLGNIRERPFSAIWTESRDTVLTGLRGRNELLEGRCSTCAYREMCGGGFRVRAFRATGRPWASDPGCYFTDAEVASLA